MRARDPPKILPLKGCVRAATVQSSVTPVRLAASPTAVSRSKAQNHQTSKNTPNPLPCICPYSILGRYKQDTCKKAAYLIEVSQGICGSKKIHDRSFITESTLQYTCSTHGTHLLRVSLSFLLPLQGWMSFCKYHSDHIGVCWRKYWIKISEHFKTSQP